MNRLKIMNAVSKAWRLAEDWNEGRIIIQLYPTNRSLLVSHQIGNSWASMGVNAHESQRRILCTLDCRDFEPEYWEGEPETEKNRLSPEDYEDAFYTIVEEIDTEIKALNVKGNV